MSILHEARRNAWRERVKAMQNVQEAEGPNAAGQIGVMWASSQGGCDPLKRLLKEVEVSPNLPPPTQAQPVFLPGLTNEDRGVESSLKSFEKSTSTPLSLSRKSSELSTHLEPNSRISRRPRSSNSVRGSDDVSPTTESPTPSQVLREKLAPSSAALSRISRSLNEKALSQHANLKHPKTSQTSSRENGSPHKRDSAYRSPSRATSTMFPHVFVQDTQGPSHKIDMDNSARMTQSNLASQSSSTPRIEPAINHPTQSLKRRRSYDGLDSPIRRPTSIADSPSKGRIRALVETVARDGTFSPTQSNGSTVGISVDTRRNIARADGASTAMHYTAEGPNLQQRRKSALGMRRPPKLLADGSSSRSSGSPTSSAERILRKSSTKNLSPNTVPQMLPPPSSSSTHRNINSALPTSNEHTRADELAIQSRGYRPASPNKLNKTSALTHRSASPSIPEFEMDIIQGPLSIGLSHGSTDSAESCHRPDQSLPTLLDEDPEAGNVSSDGTSSYGDIDIDPTALEEACKLYDW
ncbi:hypothetical protein M422DRAFT_28141 [Sphaerobolus stellatus SS14]|nr:hypothetical protein M422DRAFT_28141 [Sphaerobolus stellatus SS14]